MDDVAVSKRLSYVLRHDPGSIGVHLDAAGWVPVGTLLAALAEHGLVLSRERLERVVETNDKQRFALDPARDRIRANQGHSVAVDLGLAAVEPPARLYHGTVARNVEAIRADGLRRGDRHAVHLSPDPETARRVGARRGRAVVLVVDAAGMCRDGLGFQLSDNGVWLTEEVPARYVSVLEPDAPVSRRSRTAAPREAPGPG